jgi:hypothetical protein
VTGCLRGGQWSEGPWAGCASRCDCSSVLNSCKSCYAVLPCTCAPCVRAPAGQLPSVAACMAFVRFELLGCRVWLREACTAWRHYSEHVESGVLPVFTSMREPQVYCRQALQPECCRQYSSCALVCLCLQWTVNRLWPWLVQLQQSAYDPTSCRLAETESNACSVTVSKRLCFL